MKLTIVFNILMKIYFDIRLNILKKYVDNFVIAESTKTHQGELKKLNFNLKIL